MKIYFYIIFFFFTLINILNAQNKAVDDLISKYTDKEGFKAVVMNDPASVILQNKSGDEANLAKEMLKGIKTIKTISYNSIGKANDNCKKFNSDILKFNPGENFVELFSINEGKTKIKSLVRKSGEKVTEFVMLIADENEPTIIWLNGDINVSNISNIGKILKRQ